MKSMERSLQAGLALLLLILTAVFWVIINRSIHTLVEDFMVSRLEHDAENMIAALDTSPTRTRVRWRRINSIYNKVDSGHYYVFRFDDGRIINSPSLWDKTLQLPSFENKSEIRFVTAGPQQQKLLVWAKRFKKQGHRFALFVAEDLSSIIVHRMHFKRNFGLLALAGFVLLLVMQTLLVRKLFRKLSPVREDIKALQQGEKQQLTTNVPDEIKPLVISFNNLLNLMRSRLDRSRNALGNLAHALKGPLNLLIQSLESPDKFNRQQALSETRRISLLINRELKRARLAGKGTTTHHFDAVAELPELVKVLKRSHQHKKLQIKYNLSENVQPFGDREDMLELLGNILDNACKWASSRVECTIVQKQSYQITIADDGNGLNQDQLDHLAQRGVRLDESVEGSGLGLAIAKDIVSLYGGHLSFQKSSELGGLQVSIVLPLYVENY
jgi:signal transduction histidine kinase